MSTPENTEETTMSKTPSKAQQAREMTGTQEHTALRAIRSAVLIAKWNAKSYDDPNATRIWWAKSDYPTLEAAEAALKAAGLPTGLDFTQYGSGNYNFQSLNDLIAAAKPVEAAPVAAGARTVRTLAHLDTPAARAAFQAPAEGEKHCKRCRTTKAAADFARNSASKDGLYSICKSCEAADRQARKDAQAPIGSGSAAAIRANRLEAHAAGLHVSRTEPGCSRCAEAIGR